MALKDKKGYTLTEVLVVIALIATLVAIGVPTIVSQVTHLRLTRSVRDMTAELNGARLKAIAKNTKYKVAFSVFADNTPDAYRVFFWNTTGLTWDSDLSRAAVSLDPGMNITTPGASFDVYFFPNGVSSNSNNPSPVSSSICVENTSKANDRMKITVQGATGMITVATGC